ncbi:MAG TPA: WhiB family transcriptional regulator [Iamia sp.]|nr:WhiB family transcriptional regulator [Iamia sp.]
MLAPSGPDCTVRPRGRGEARSPVTDTTTAPSWRRQAACQGLDPTIFFPSDDDDECLDAKAVCAQCPVADLCLEHALGVREKEGIWGGCTERERRRIIRQRRRSA